MFLQLPLRCSIDDTHTGTPSFDPMNAAIWLLRTHSWICCPDTRSRFRNRTKKNINRASTRCTISPPLVNEPDAAMKVVLLGDACVPDDINELGLPWRQGPAACLRPGDFAIMPFDTMDASLKGKLQLRAVLSCCEDPVAAIRTILSRDIVVIGKATREELPTPLFNLFGKVCYVKCDARGHKGDKFLCTNNDNWYARHAFIKEHNPGCAIYFPNKYEKGKPVPYKRAPKGVNGFGSEIQYKHLPDIKKGAPGWLTSGLATAFHFLYETNTCSQDYPDTCLYMFRFSHWCDGQPTTPPAGMQNAFGRPPGRHNVDIERSAAEYLQKTGRVFSLELNQATPQALPQPQLAPPVPVTPASNPPAQPPPKPKPAPVFTAHQPPPIPPPPSFESPVDIPQDRLVICALIEKRFGKRPPQTMLDIGCGMALEAEYFHKKYGTRVWLVEGDNQTLTPEQNAARHRRTKFGPAANYQYAINIADLERSLSDRGVTATILDPSIAQSPSHALPKFDLILSKDACGMRFPVGEYGRLMRACRNDDTKIILELNQNRKLEHRKDGVVVSTALLQRKKSCLAEVRLIA